MAEPTYVLEASGVSKSFGGTDVLKSAALWARAGEITTLLGRNGSGKTTLLRIVAGQLRADQGVVHFNGEVRERPRLAELAREGLMYVPQEQLLVPRRLVRQHFSALAAVFEHARVEEAVHAVGITDLLDQRADTLSGGERMRVSLGLALARRPTVLIADEPLVGLAPMDQEAMAGILRRIASEGAAVITSGHDARMLLEVSDAIVWSVAGTTHLLGNPADARRHHQFCREYLGRAAN